MSDVKIDLEEHSKYRVAKEMAETILLRIEKKKWEDVSRHEYLMAIYESIRALSNYLPTKS